MPSPPLTIGRACEEAVDEPFVGVRRIVSDEVIHRFGRRWQAGEIDRDPPDQGSSCPPRVMGKAPRLRAGQGRSGRSRFAARRHSR